jgi:hypothetical protein
MRPWLLGWSEDLSTPTTTDLSTCWENAANGTVSAPAPSATSSLRRLIITLPWQAPIMLAGNCPHGSAKPTVANFIAASYFLP